MAERTPAQTGGAGYLQLVETNSNYRSLWIGEIISLFGDWFNLIASASLVSNLTQSGLAVGGLFVARMLAPFLVSPLAGVAADRYNRKWLLIACDLSRAVIVMGFLLVREASQVWLLYTLTIFQLAISGVFFPTRNAILPDLVSRRELGTANALSSTTWSVMLALGSAVGGLVAGGWGIYPAFVVDAVSFLLSAFFLAHIHYQHTQAPGERSIRAGFAQYLEGLHYFRRNRDLLAIALHKAAVSLTVNGPFQVIQVALAERVFVIGEGGGTSLGLLYAVAGVGTGIGPILARRFTGDRPQPMRAALALAYAIVAVGMLVSAGMTSFGVVLFGSFLRAFGGGMIWVFSTQLLLQLAPDYIRGRVFSTEFALFTLGNASGTALAGFALDGSMLDLGQMMLWSGLLGLLPGLLWAGWVARQPEGSGEIGTQ